MTWFEPNQGAVVRPAEIGTRTAGTGNAGWIVSRTPTTIIDSGVFRVQGGPRPQPRTKDAGVEEPRAAEPAPAPSVGPQPPTLPPNALEPPAESLADVEVPHQPPMDAARAAELDRMLLEMGHVRGRLLRQAEQQLVALAGRIARRVIGRELACDPKILQALASEGIEALVARDQITVRLGQGLDEATFESIRDRLQAQSPGCRVLSDPSLGPGGCVVETELVRVDESLDVRLANVMSAWVHREERAT